MMQFDYRNLKRDDNYYQTEVADQHESIIFNLCKNDFLTNQPEAFAFLISEDQSTQPLTSSSPSPTEVTLKEHDLYFNQSNMKLFYEST
jgi:hypothetical protein